MKKGSRLLLEKLKEAGFYPYSDLDREPVVWSSRDDRVQEVRQKFMNHRLHRLSEWLLINKDQKITNRSKIKYR